MASANGEEAGGQRSILGVPLTGRNARNLAGMAIASAWPPNLAVLVRNALALRRERPWRDHLRRRSSPDRATAAALGWIRRSQDRVGSGGVGDFQFHGWTAGYPEVTGYIIPTLWDHHHALDDGDLAERAVRMADWEIGLQQPEGGFESLYEGEGRPPVAFNTGQVIRGLLRTHRETGEQRYLDAAVRAGDWMVAHQEGDGSWTKANYLGMKRTYDAYAAAGLAQLHDATGDRRYADAALANAEFVLGNQRPNGWFELCDNTAGPSTTPITHTLCYTIDGLTEIGRILAEDRLIGAADLAADAIAERVEPGGRLPGRFDSDWRPAASHVVLTGSAQLGVILAARHRRTGSVEDRRRSLELADFVAFAQDLNAIGADRSGGIAGSFPIWGRYVPLKYPSWATKFFLDHLLLVGAE